MAEVHKKFRHLIPPGSTFDFMGISRAVNMISLLVLAASAAALLINWQVRGSVLNWTIDFTGGTEVVLSARESSDGSVRTLKMGDVRAALENAGKPDDEVSDITWMEKTRDGEREVAGVVIRTKTFGAVGAERGQQVIDAVRTQLADREILGARWSGDNLFLRTKKAITEAEMAAIFTAAGLEAKPLAEVDVLSNATVDPATAEYVKTFPVWGLDRAYEKILEGAFPGTDFVTDQSYVVSAKAGDTLFYDGLKALIFAMALIMLYLVVRFDIRYAPGAIKATLHDAVIVVGVLGAFWVPVSLSTLAALLTVVGYSVNDTAIVFDRIRENVALHKDMKIERLVNLSLNEVLGRSLLTSLFVFAVTLMMNIFGDGLLKNFAFVLNVGVLVGAASTIFLSAPVFVWITKKYYSGPASAARTARSAEVAAEP